MKLYNLIPTRISYILLISKGQGKGKSKGIAIAVVYTYGIWNP